MIRSNQVQAKPASSEAVLPLRTRFREEMNCQIVHDSIHRREGWTLSWLLESQGMAVGFGSIAIAGPWKDKPTVFEFYVVPEHRTRAFELFEVFRQASGARFFEAQTNELLLPIMVHAYGADIASEKIVFADGQTTLYPAKGAVLRCVTASDEIRRCLEQRQGGGEWILELDGVEIGRGGILFHYNRPYGDIYMEIAETQRGRGWGAYLVQELKRECYDLGAVPAARCSPTNVASRQTLLRAGFVPVGHIIYGSLKPGVE
jgi:RimJ/RimL family protein N-acetyltransferase